MLEPPGVAPGFEIETWSRQAMVQLQRSKTMRPVIFSMASGYRAPWTVSPGGAFDFAQVARRKLTATDRGSLQAIEAWLALHGDDSIARESQATAICGSRLEENSGRCGRAFGGRP